MELVDLAVQAVDGTVRFSTVATECHQAVEPPSWYIVSPPFSGNLTSSRWARMNRCSHDTALRDITNLIDCGILARNPGGGRRTSYRMKTEEAKQACPKTGKIFP